MTSTMHLMVLSFVVIQSCNVRANLAFVESFSNIVSYVVNGELKVNEKQEFQQATNLYEETELVSLGQPVVSTTSGDVIGSTLEEAHAFFSIPYAAPPIGSLRFRDPIHFEANTEPINATVPDRIVCPQLPYDECSAGYCLMNQNENCLVLNVFIPRTVNLSVSNPTNNLPVLFWIHGGAFFGGTGTSPKSDGRWLSNATQTIVVSINYRLGAFGFLVYNRGNDHLNGNQGLKDQQMAMTWVQQNIANFGGDKDRVTIFGESAGAQSVMFHTLSSVSRPLYRRAILQSNAPIFPHQTPEEAMNVTQRLLDQLDCFGENEFECLLNAPTRKLTRYPVIMAASTFDGDAWSAVEPYRPILDGVEFTDQPLTLFQSGKWNTDREYIMGANTEEVEILQFYIPGQVSLPKDAFWKINTMFLGTKVGEAMAKYYEDMIGPDGSDYSKVLGIEAGDAFFICPNRAMMRFSFETADNPDGFYNYIFDQAPDGKYCDEVYPRNETCGYVYHSAEIPYVFRSGPGFGYHFDENETDVADQLSKYWGNFARIGDPNNDINGPSFDNAAFWPPYMKTEYPLPSNEDHVENMPYKIFAEDISLLERNRAARNQASVWSNVHIQAKSPYIESRYKEEICDFWDSQNFYVQFPATDQSTTVPDDLSMASSKPLSTTSSAEKTASHSILFGFLLLTLLLKLF